MSSAPLQLQSRASVLSHRFALESVCLSPTRSRYYSGRLGDRVFTLKAVRPHVGPVRDLPGPAQIFQSIPIASPSGRWRGSPTVQTGCLNQRPAQPCISNFRLRRLVTCNRGIASGADGSCCRGRGARRDRCLVIVTDERQRDRRQPPSAQGVRAQRHRLRCCSSLTMKEHCLLRRA